MTGNVLTPAKVAEIRQSPCLCQSPEVGYLCDSHEALQAENARLRGLIEGMRHERECGANYWFGKERGYDPCTCVKSQVNL